MIPIIVNIDIPTHLRMGSASRRGPRRDYK